MRRIFDYVMGALMFASLSGSMSAYGQETVSLKGYGMGTIVVKTSERHLYYVVSATEALRYPVAVGRAGMQWTGTATIEGKYIRPPWCCDKNGRTIRSWDRARNPMGAAAMTVRGGEYAIHGTNDPSSIGKFVSHGCIRMFDKDVLNLYRMVSVGTTEVVVEP